MNFTSNDCRRSRTVSIYNFFSCFYEMYCIDFVLVPMKEHVLLLIITIDNNLLFNVPTYIVIIYYRKKRNSNISYENQKSYL